MDRSQVFKAKGTVEKVAPVVNAILRSKSEVENLTVENDGQVVVDLQTSSESRELFDLGLHKRNLHWIETGLSEEALLIEAGPVKWQMRRG